MLTFCGLSVCLSVCQSRSCIVLKRQKISTRFLLHITAPCLSQKFGLHGQRLPPQILPQSDSPVDLSVGDIRWQIATEELDIAQRSQWRAYRKPPFLSTGTIGDSIQPPFSQNGCPNCTPGPTSRCVLPPGEYDGIYRQGISPYVK